MARQSVTSALVPFVHELGRVPDSVIAEKAGVSRAVTVSYRNQLGIAPYEGHRQKKKSETKTETSTLETTEAAMPKAKSGRPRGRPRKNPVTPAVPTVESTPAVTVAANPTESAPVVAARKRGRPRKNVVAPEVVAAPVAPVVEVVESVRSRSFRGRKSVLEAYVHMLGRQSDADVARLAGVTAENVRTYRHRRGIMAEWREGDAPVGEMTEAAVVEVAPVVVHEVKGTSGVAFLVGIEVAGATHQHVVVAADITGAAVVAVEGAARRYPGGNVRSVERLAELLG